jgi:hypothetical protein
MDETARSRRRAKAFLHLFHSSALKMEAVFFSETLVNFYRTRRRYVLEDCTLYWNLYTVQYRNT